MTTEERWNALYSVLNLRGDLNACLQHVFVKRLECLKVELQHEVLRANSRVYEGKAVIIGGTITGFVSRLEAIRTTNPFAILAEEASEVMEPLLVSCFSSSTRKLEKIGDHMQLQPAPQGIEVPSSVLSIQRRMRKNICDLTRNFYVEITTIEDHETCGSKVIGFHCGVPPQSIAVLTPYKGQLMLMRRMLMNTYGLCMKTKGRDSRPAPSCIVSTVDRFQGDEADIVVISLVIDGKSRTPFVKLQNRMRETSKSDDCLAESSTLGDVCCWKCRLLRRDYTLAEDVGALKERRTVAKEERDLKLRFCTVVCSVDLEDYHSYRNSIKCDGHRRKPDVEKHNQQCHVKVESPCSRHPRELVCSNVTASARGMYIDKALEKYQCNIRVEVSLPCGHNQNMTCYSHSEIVAGRRSWLVCNKEAIAPHEYSECKRVLKCTCSEFGRSMH
ncbi:unnamed protein product [Peronospora belbahrii]|uniref:DNA2/NAM7 helicase-like C-terminal domain-containing protein n=1 Tax=Peronospora belbahrii TaxID=622444 RepID=A0AAU9KJE4_9STRA|nr:unnamed protein product [Peronospora belbahrii]